MLLKYSAEAIKMFLNKGQYNQSQEFQEDEIKEAHQRWNNFVENIPNYNNDVLNESDIVNNVVKALEDDFNTPLAITILYASLKELNTNKSARLADEILIVLKLLSIVPNVTNLDLVYEKWKNNQEMPDEIRLLLEKRIEAKSNKDFKLSDNLRDIILEKGWSLKDTVNGFEIQKIIQ
jgi:Cysteinyl-tRNA synthetase